MATYKGVPIRKLPPVRESRKGIRYIRPSRTTLLEFCAERCRRKGDTFDKGMEVIESSRRVSRYSLPIWQQDKLFEIEELYERSLEEE